MAKVKMVAADGTGWIGEGDFDFAPRVGDQVYLPSSGSNEVVSVGHEGDGSGNFSLIIGVTPTKTQHADTGV